jgi:exodeoxyribonuclease VII large subunit
LAAEGLFDEHRKRPLPRFPEHLTLVTSPHGAAVHDFLRIAHRRLPSLHIAIYPVPVQGDQAAGEMIRALATINDQLARTDAIVLCRGGGSIEDLQAFNDEGLARAIRASNLPVVSAVGHEIDFTIADFAADLRAPTPSGAAELLTPDVVLLRRGLAQTCNRLYRLIQTRLDGQAHRLALVRQRLHTMPHPLDRLLLRVDQLALTLQTALRGRITTEEQRLHRAVQRLGRRDPVHLLALWTERLTGVRHRLELAMGAKLAQQERQLGRVAGLLQAVSPLATLARGYAIVRLVEGRQAVVTDEGQVRIGEAVDLTLNRGALRCRVEAKNPTWKVDADRRK